LSYRKIQEDGGPGKAELRKLRARKWEHAAEVVKHFEAKGFHVSQFPSDDTPH
jgi:hypothetical protein